jgi:hypothetical protein
MGFFRRDEETLNERLLREAGLDQPVPQQEAGTPVAGDGLPLERPREWDILTTADAPGLDGDHVEFATLPDGSILVDEETGDANLGPLADAVEQQIAPPYRARGIRSSGTLWSVSARRIEVATLEASADTIEVTSVAGAVTTIVDGRPAAPFPELARDGDYFLHAEHLDGDLWEVEVGRL